MNISISGYKDTDREILLAMNDKDLLAACSLNKHLFNNVCDDNFFRRKLLRSYPNTLKYKQPDINYKQYYLKVVYYVSKLKEEFDYSYVSGNPQNQYNIFKNNPRSKQLLSQASQYGELEIVKEAVRRGADIHKSGEEALRYSSFLGHLEIVKYLVSLGADIHYMNDYAFRWASENGQLDVVKDLVSIGADISSEHNWAVRSASRKGHLEVVKYLLSLRENMYDEALRFAEATGDHEVVTYLNSLQ